MIRINEGLLLKKLPMLPPFPPSPVMCLLLLTNQALEKTISTVAYLCKRVIKLRGASFVLGGLRPTFARNIGHKKPIALVCI